MAAVLYHWIAMAVALVLYRVLRTVCPAGSDWGIRFFSGRDLACAVGGAFAGIRRAVTVYICYACATKNIYSAALFRGIVSTRYAAVSHSVAGALSAEASTGGATTRGEKTDGGRRIEGIAFDLLPRSILQWFSGTNERADELSVQFSALDWRKAGEGGTRTTFSNFLDTITARHFKLDVGKTCLR